MFLRSNSFRRYTLVPIVVLALGAIGCANTATKDNEPAPSSGNSTKGYQTVGPHLCQPQKSRIAMSKEQVGSYASFFTHKFVKGTLTEAQLICDLGQPKEETTMAAVFQTHQLPFQNGDRFLRWGDHHTNNPSDDISIMVVVDASGKASSIVKYDTAEKTISKVTKLDGKIRVTTGTYTATRTVSKKL